MCRAVRLLRLGYGRVAAAQYKIRRRVPGSVVAARFTNQRPRAILTDHRQMLAVGGERAEPVGEPVEPLRGFHGAAGVDLGGEPISGDC